MTQAQLQRCRYVGALEVQGQDRASLVQREVHLPAAVFALNRAGCYEEEENSTVLDLLGKGFGPLRARGDALVVPDMEAHFAQASDLRIYKGSVIVRIAHENEWLGAFVSWKRPLQRTLRYTREVYSQFRNVRKGCSLHLWPANGSILSPKKRSNLTCYNITLYGGDTLSDETL